MSRARALSRGDLLPSLRTAVPGPRSLAISARLRAAEAPGINTLYRDQPSLAWRSARGANVLDVDGNRFIDLTAGFGAAAVGHANPAVRAAIRRQSALLLHGLGDVHAHEPRLELAELLQRLSPVDDPLVHFAVTGSEAVEVALKTAFLATGRSKVLAFEGAYHGLTFGALAATSRALFREPFHEHLTPHITRAPFGLAIPEIEALLARSANFACVIVEPILGREGIVLPPPDWLRELAALCASSGVLLIADEIFTGCGRSGTLFAVEHEQVRPDLLCCGKALAGGMPLAAVIGRRPLMQVWKSPGEALHTGTFVAHPTACAAALAVLGALRAERLPQRAQALGTDIERTLRPLAAHPRVREIRGRGLLWAIELDDADLAAHAVALAMTKGVILLAGGSLGSTLQIAPPLTISSRQLSTALTSVAMAVVDASVKAQASTR